MVERKRFGAAPLVVTRRRWAPAHPALPPVSPNETLAPPNNMVYSYFRTKTIQWARLSLESSTHKFCNGIAIGQPPKGLSYVIRYIGEGSGRMYYLYRTGYEVQRYIRCLPHTKLLELCEVAEHDYAANGVEPIRTEAYPGEGWRKPAMEEQGQVECASRASSYHGGSSRRARRLPPPVKGVLF